MTKEELILKYEEKLSEINDSINNSWSAKTDIYHPLQHDKRIIFEFIGDLKNLNLSAVIKS